ncbi:MAG: hypothetical protein HY901_00395 [Deltaproteobacteria bacterium]|nr:hypothetical protein [Deltaproteobacteria bacterium]
MGTAEREAQLELSDEQAREIAEQVVMLTAVNDVQTMAVVGDTILKRVFANDEKLFRSQSRYKGASLTKLATQPGMADANWNRHKLDSAVEIYLLSKVHQGLGSWKHLLVSHFAVVVGLVPETQKELLDLAERERWTVTRLKEAAGKHRPAPAPAPVTKKTRFLRELSDALKVLDQWCSFADGLATHAIEAGIPADDTAQLGLAMMDVHGILRSWQEQLGVAAPAPRPIEEIANTILGLGKRKLANSRASKKKQMKHRKKTG